MPVPEQTSVGWICAYRNLGRIAFLVISNGLTTRDYLVRSAELIRQLRRVSHESLLKVSAQNIAGEWVLCRFELLRLAPSPPFSLTENDKPPVRVLMEHPTLRFRRHKERSVLRLIDRTLSILRDDLVDRGFVEIITPRFLSDPSLGGAELLRAGAFGETIYLNQSTQLYRQMLLPELEHVFELTSIFRGDHHSTSWHLNEFAALEVETSNIQDVSDVIELASNLISAVLTDSDMRAGIETLDTVLPKLVQPVPQIHYREALHLLMKEFGRDHSGQFNLTATGNRLLSQWVRTNLGSDFLVLIGTPASYAQFYDMIDSEDPNYTRGFVILCRGISFVCGGQRLHNVEDYFTSLESRSAPMEPLARYLTSVNDGWLPHGGFSLAIGRFIARVLDLQNLRQVVSFPRDSHALNL